MFNLNDFFAKVQSERENMGVGVELIDSIKEMARSAEGKFPVFNS